MGWARKQHFGEEQLSAYLDAQLDTRESARLESHLIECQRCSTALDQLQQVRALVGALPRAAAGRSFALGPRFERQKSSPRRPWAASAPLTLAPVAAFTLFASLLLVDFVLLPEGSPDQSRASIEAARGGAATLQAEADAKASPPPAESAARRSPEAEAAAPALVPPPATGDAPSLAAAAERSGAQPEVFTLPAAGDAAGGVTSSLPAEGQPVEIYHLDSDGADRLWLRAMEVLAALALLLSIGSWVKYGRRNS